MSNPVLQPCLAIRKVLASKGRVLIFAITTIAFFGLFIAIPLVTIPGNDLMFQLKIFRTRDYFIMAFLAMLVGLNVVFQIHTFQQKREKKNLAQSTTAGATTGIIGVFAGVVGTAACASCLASLFGLVGLGTGSVLFILKNQSYFLLGAIALMTVSLYFAAKKVNKTCDSC